jgi:hypothetical protein
MKNLKEAWILPGAAALITAGIYAYVSGMKPLALGCYVVSGIFFIVFVGLQFSKDKSSS